VDSIPLNYDATFVGRGFPSPIVEVTIHGQSARFLVDTGASVHALAAWFVKSAGIKAELAASTVRGSTGNETPVRVVRQLDGKLENEHRLHLDEAVVVEFPPIFAELKIAGLLSPQLLAPPGQAAVLDLRVPSLMIEPFQDVVDSARVTPLRDAHVCNNAGSMFTNRSYAIPITVQGGTATVIVDSGATRTLIASESQIAKALESRGIEGNHTQGVGGAVESSRHVPGVEIQRAGAPVVLDLGIGGSPAPSCGPDGLLGMDALRQCLLVLGESGLGMTCTQ
jgi:hypothetical protein